MIIHFLHKSLIEVGDDNKIIKNPGPEDPDSLFLNLVEDKKLNIANKSQLAIYHNLRTETQDPRRTLTVGRRVTDARLLASLPAPATPRSATRRRVGLTDRRPACRAYNSERRMLISPVVADDS